MEFIIIIERWVYILVFYSVWVCMVLLGYYLRDVRWCVFLICQNDELLMWLIQCMIKEGNQDQVLGEVDKLNTYKQVRSKRIGVYMECRWFCFVGQKRSFKYCEVIRGYLYVALILWCKIFIQLIKLYKIVIFQIFLDEKFCL